MSDPQNILSIIQYTDMIRHVDYCLLYSSYYIYGRESGAGELCTFTSCDDGSDGTDD